VNKRVLIIGPFSPGALPESFARAFEQLGHEVFRFDSDRAYFDAGLGAAYRLVRGMRKRTFWDRVNRSTIEVARCVRPQLILAVKGTYLHPETIRRLRGELGVAFANYYPDDPYIGVPWNPHKLSNQRTDLMEALRQYSRVWLWERRLVQRLAANGVAASYLPFGVDQEVFYPHAPADCVECGESHAAVFIGQHHDKRQAHIAAVHRHRVGVWGGRWDGAQRAFRGRHTIHRNPAFGSNCACLYAGAAVALNVLADHNVPGHNMRTFEVPASGGVMLATYTVEQHEFFPENEAALYYRNPGEIDDKIERVLKDPQWAARLRQQAMTIAAQHHYTERVKVVLAELAD